MRRRTLLVAAASTALVGTADAREILPLWPTEPPGPGTGPGGTGAQREAQGRNGAVVTEVARPSLEVMRPARPNGRAMLVAAGGGYRQIETGAEALPAAAWLASRGVTAFVLRYRLPGEGWTALAPLQDAQRALQVIAGQTGIGATGVLGFSAGGHLMGLAAAGVGYGSYAPVDALDRTPARAVLAGLIYPVISLLPPLQHTGTHRRMAGEDPAAEAAYSVQRRVTPAMPPVFLAQAADDPVSPVMNSVLMWEACRAAGVPVEMHLFQEGGHGWGMGRGETAQWPGLFATWAAIQGFGLG